jgi:hypothetical protein
MVDPESRRARMRPKKHEEKLTRRQRWIRMFIAVIIIFLMVFSSLMVFFRG